MNRHDKKLSISILRKALQQLEAVDLLGGDLASNSGALGYAEAAIQSVLADLGEPQAIEAERQFWVDLRRRGLKSR